MLFFRYHYCIFFSMIRFQRVVIIRKNEYVISIHWSMRHTHTSIQNKEKTVIILCMVVAKEEEKREEKKRNGKRLLVNSYNSAPLLKKKEKERQSNNET